MAKPKVFVTRVIPDAGLNKVREFCDAEIWTEPLPPPAEVVRYTNEQMRSGNRRRYGLLEWPTLLRKLDRIDPSYRN